MTRTDFIGPLLQRWRFDHVFWKFENKIFIKSFGLIVSHMEIGNINVEDAEQTGGQTNNHAITISKQKSFSQYVQFIKSNDLRVP